MVKEREPSRAVPSAGSPVSSIAPRAPTTITSGSSSAPRDSADRTNWSTTKPTHREPLGVTANIQPVFGKPTPPKSQFGRMSHVFNVPKRGQTRPEHHRPQQTHSLTTTRPDGATAAAFNKDSSSGPNPLYPPGLAPAYTPSMSQQAAAHHRPVPIPKPSNAPYAYKPAVRPMFSTHDYGSSGITGPPRTTIDLTKDDDYDGFDPNRAFRDDQFGAPDPFEYRDPTQADKDLKDLLSGHFGDEEDVPKLRLRKRKLAAPKGEPRSQGADALASKLEALNVKDKEAAKKEEKAEEEEDEEDGTVEELAVKLLPHQVEGVAWMIDRENGKRKKNGVLPRGGILADDMGVGKTIQSIALLMTNPRPEIESTTAGKSTSKKDGIPSGVSKCTLIVAPVAVVSQWQEEIKTKVAPGYVPRVLVHHGAKRSKSSEELKKYDVVITTFGILSTEHAASSSEPDGPKSALFGVHWYRVILDEAQNIKNRSAKCSQAAYALDSWYRWCLTGTPMQNNLDELQSLIRFLRIKPYCNYSMWKEQISGPLKNGRGNLAMKRLNYFLKAIMKRRLKTILQEPGALNFGKKTENGETKRSAFTIVDKTVEIIEAQFDARERRFYERLMERAEENLNDMMGADRKDYIGALVLLLRLRQACNHPQLVGGSIDKDMDALEADRAVPQTPRRKATGPSEDLDDLAALLGGLSVAKKRCDVCQHTLGPDAVKRGEFRCEDCENDLKYESASENVKAKAKPRGTMERPAGRRNRKVVLDSDDDDEGDWVVPESERQAPNLGRAGGSDDEDAEGGGEWIDSQDSETDEESDEGAKPSRIRRREPIEISSDSEDKSFSTGGTCPMSSTKIRYLMDILRRETPEHKVIVFSQFTSMLNLIEPFLDEQGYRYVRYDGSMRPDVRDNNLNQLRNDKKTRILLCSLKCGGVGLNLTVASRVILVEPFWNPFAESQAIDRVHRINQTKPVHVYRLTIAGTVEERILRLQEAKQALADAAIEGGSRKDAQKLSFEDILKLFGREAESKPEAGYRSRSGLDERLRFAGSQAVELVKSAPRTSGSQGRAERAEDPVWGRR